MYGTVSLSSNVQLIDHGVGCLHRCSLQLRRWKEAQESALREQQQRVNELEDQTRMQAVAIERRRLDLDSRSADLACTRCEYMHAAPRRARKNWSG